MLALGLLGQGDLGTEWQPIFERACTMIDAHAQNEWSCVPVLSMYWRAGFERLTGDTI